MPTTAPVMSTSGPPELPGLIAASVWIAGYVVELPCVVGADVDRAVQRADDAAGDGRVEAERRADRDDALADAEVGRLADRRRREVGDAGGLDHRGVGERVGAEDLGVGAGAVVEGRPERAAARAPSTTWLLVRMVPSAVRMMPEPDPVPCAPATSIFTTLGRTFWATDSTEPSAAGVSVCRHRRGGHRVGLGGARRLVVGRVPQGRPAEAGTAAHEQRGRDDRRRQARTPPAGLALRARAAGLGGGAGVSPHRGRLAGAAGVWMRRSCLEPAPGPCGCAENGLGRHRDLSGPARRARAYLAALPVATASSAIHCGTSSSSACSSSVPTHSSTTHHEISASAPGSSGGSM